MSQISEGLMTAIAAGSGAALGALMLLGGGGLAGAGVAALIVFAGMTQVHGLSTRKHHRKLLTKEVAALRRAHQLLDEAQSIAAERAVEREAALAAQAQARDTKLVAEMQMLETLVRQFAESLVKRVQMLELKTNAQRPAGATQPVYQAKPAENGDPVLLDMIQRALIENRVDLHMQPIVTLPQRKTRHYEALTRLRTPEGALIMPAQYLRVAEAAGLMSAVDNLLLFRCVQFVRRIAQRSSESTVFCNISVHSLRDAAFFPQFVDFMRAHRDLAGQIVFELPQSAFLGLGPNEDANLGALGALGFSYSVDKITRLDLEPEQLRRRGVRFVKVSAGLMLDPHAAAGRAIRPEDLGETLARYGIGLIIEKIENERQVIDLLDYGVTLGQGYLFGDPRPLKEAPAEETRAAEPSKAPAPAPAAEAGGATALIRAGVVKRAARG